MSPAGAQQVERPLPPDSDAPTREFESELPLVASAALGEDIFGIARADSGLGFFGLRVDRSGTVSLGERIHVDVPDDFVLAGLGVRAGRIVLCGAVPFVWDSWEANDELTPEVAVLLGEDYPAFLPTSGTRTIEMIGLRAAAFAVDPPRAVDLELPEFPRRLATVVTEARETVDRNLYLVAHSEDRDEGLYGSALELVEEHEGGWTVTQVADGLGESGPNRLGTSPDGEDRVVVVTTLLGAYMVHQRVGGRWANTKTPVDVGEIRAVVSGPAGFQVFGRGEGGMRSWRTAPDLSSWSPQGFTRTDGNEVVDVVAVAGTAGTHLALGRSSAQLVEK